MVTAQRWSLLESPEGASASLDPTDGPTASLVPDAAGVWRAAFTVRTEGRARETCVASVEVTREAPLLRCPPTPQRVRVGEPLTLEAPGRASSREWSVSPSGATVEPGSGASAVFRARRRGSYEVRLRASDGSREAECVVQVEAQDTLSVACTPARAQLWLGETIAFEASAPAPATVSWALVEKPASSASELTSGAGPRTTLRPDVPGRFVLQAEARDGAERAVCEAIAEAIEPPALQCGDPVETTTGATATVHARVVREEPRSIAWSIHEAPPGSRAELPPPDDALAPSFTPDVAGHYLLRASARFADRVEQCDVPVEVRSGDGLRMELRWDRTDVNLDVYLVHPRFDATFPDPVWLCDPPTCVAPTLPWGGPGAEDNPRIDMDYDEDNGGLGPEVVRIPSPAPLTYRVGVVPGRGAWGSTQAWVRLFCGPPSAEPAAEFGPATFGPGHCGTWRVANVTIADDGSCRLDPIDERVGLDRGCGGMEDE